VFGLRRLAQWHRPVRSRLAIKNYFYYKNKKKVVAFLDLFIGQHGLAL
jgi:hypothetical protein